MPLVTSLTRASSAARRSGVSKRMPLGLARPQHVGKRTRRADHVIHRIAAGGAHQIVRILALRQHREFQALARLQARHREFDGAIGRAQARIVAVETKYRLVRHLPKQRKLVLGQRRAERRDGGGEARRHHGDHVDIAFDRDHGWRRHARPARALAML